MHKEIIYKYLKIVNFILILIISLRGSSEECIDFDKSIENAKKSFQYYDEIELNYSLRMSFIDNYNKFSQTKKPLDATKVILFMLLDQNIWYVFASKKNCLVFWIDLEPDKFIEMIDGGTISKNQGNWRK